MAAVTLFEKDAEEEVKYGPPQGDTKDLSGLTMDEDTWKEWAQDPLGRDKFTKAMRMEQWKRTEELFEQNKDAPLPVDMELLHLPPYGIHLVAGDLGAGKTTWSAYIAKHFRERGWNVFSTAGLLFGQKLGLQETYAFPDHVTPGAVIFADEIHTLLDVYSSNSQRQRTFAQATTAMRKEQITCIGASRNTMMVGWEYKGNADTLILPSLASVPPGSRVTPPFVNLRIWAKSHPYDRVDPQVQELYTYMGRRAPQKMVSSWFPKPQDVLEAAMLMDSFESLKLGENFDISADVMKRAREGDTGGEKAVDSIIQKYLWFVWQVIQDYEGKTMTWTQIRDIVADGGHKVTAIALADACRSVLPTVSVRGFDVAELYAAMKPIGFPTDV